MVDCASNTFTGVHVWRGSALGEVCKHCGSVRRAVEGQDAAFFGSPLDWRERAQTALADLIASGDPFTSEDITLVVGLPAGHIGTNANNAVGALIARARREGIIRSCGRQPSRNPRSNGAMLEVWTGKR